MKSRVAILDLGTNTFHLLIAEINDSDRPLLVYNETIAVKLGEGGITEGIIADEAFERGIKALLKFKLEIERFGVSKVKGVATSAIRSAANGNDFIEQVRSATGLEVQVIEGGEEAQLIYQGVRAAVDLVHPTMIVDIGGGSVEFIICDKREIFWKKSYPIGAARLMALFHHSDPISPTDTNKLTSYLESILTDLKHQLNIYQPNVLVGSAGAFETFAELLGPEFKTSFENPAQIIDVDGFKQIAETILKSTHAEREIMPEIIPVRVDMIVVATILTTYILNISGIKSLIVSSYSLKEGILFSTVK